MIFKYKDIQSAWWYVEVAGGGGGGGGHSCRGQLDEISFRPLAFRPLHYGIYLVFYNMADTEITV